MKIPSVLATAAKAALDKKATDAVVLDVSQSASFTDHFLLLTGANQRQLLAIVEAIEEEGPHTCSLASYHQGNFMVGGE